MAKVKKVKEKDFIERLLDVCFAYLIKHKDDNPISKPYIEMMDAMATTFGLWACLLAKEDESISKQLIDRFTTIANKLCAKTNKREKKAKSRRR